MIFEAKNEREFGKKIAQKLFWLYLILLIFEGALRKWILPGFAAPLLIVRDPVVILIYLVAFRYRLFPMTKFMVALLFIALGSFVLSYFVDEFYLYVTLYGFRCNFLHLPLIFILPLFLKYSDIIKIGNFLLKIVFPMAILMVYQFFSSPENWINKGAGADAVQIRATVENIRPPGVFSYITGIAEYFALVTAFLLYYTINRKFKNVPLQFLSISGIIAGSLVSISRLTMSGIIGVLIVGFCSLFFQPSKIRQHLIALFILGGLSVAIIQVDFAKKAIETFNVRLEEASNAEGGSAGFFRRILDSTFGYFTNMDQIPLQGYGLGMGTAAGSQMIKGEVYLLTEDEVGRILYESGPIFGLAFILWRWGLCLYLLVRSLFSAANGYPLPLYFWGAAAPMLLISQIGRPTSLGFMVVISGLCFTALQTKPAAEDVEPGGMNS